LPFFVNQLPNQDFAKCTQRRFHLQNGRGSRVRTRDLRFWRPPLYQLSYTPICSNFDTTLFQRIQRANRKIHPPFGKIISVQFNLYSSIAETTPAPTVRPPSRIAKRRPSSIAIGAIKFTVIAMLSPGITISVPSGSSTVPVTSVVRK
jgi:hypothetical protein